MSERRTSTVRVRRGGENDPVRFDEWAVPYKEGMSVLDALLWIRRECDSTLAVRYSCLNANACKECSCVIDGKVGYLCTTRLGETPVTCEPLPKKRLLRDLVVDITAAGERPIDG